MTGMTRSLLLLTVFLSFAGCASVSPLHPDRLRCDSRDNPLGVDDPRPTLSWALASARRNEFQTAYQIVVSAGNDEAEVWNSGKVPSDATHDIDYAGPALVAHQRYVWKVRTWDRDDVPSPWSKAAAWTQGPMRESDWQRAQWIAARTISPLRSGTANGYHAAETKDAAEEKWVQIDLGQPTQIDAVTLHPARPDNYQPVTPGFGFPVRFKIECSDVPAFTDRRLIADHTVADYPNPGSTPATFPANVRARYVRITGTRHWLRKDATACLAFSEISVTAGGSNVAVHRSVTAKDSVETAGWGRAGLTDGVTPDSFADAYAAPLLRKDFHAPLKPSRATATICGLGYYELLLNGRKVGDHVLDPGFTAFDKRAQYLMYDVTDQIRRGDNAIGVILGGGWYELATPDLFGDEKAPWTSPPKLRLLLTLEYPDGSRQLVTSDPSWKWSTGHITFQCLRAGETHDLRRAKPTWATDPTTSADWRPVVAAEAPAGKLVAQRHPPMKATGTVKPTEVIEPKPGIYVYKLPENLAGWARFTTSGTRGQKITLRFAERLKPDGTIDRRLSGHTFGRWQTGEMILSGAGRETFEARFCYHGFQYVQVEGLHDKPVLSDLVAVKVHTALTPTGTFTSSSDLLNRSHKMILRTYLANLHSIPTDCPQREKMGWLCDGHVAAHHAMLNFDARTLYEKWILDMADAADPDGSMPSIVPTPGWSRNGHPGEDFQCPWWGGATLIVPWTLYQTYGDIGILRDHYDPMRRYVDSLTSRAKDHLLTFGLGDWLEVDKDGRPVRTPTDLTSTAGYAYFTRLLSDIATLLNKPDDAAKYAALSKEITAAFNKKYLRPDGRYGDDTQTAPALALNLNLAPPDQRDLIARRLLENIAARKDQLSTGLVGTLYLFKALEELNCPDLIYSLLTAPDYPGYAHMMKSGATTLWESWDGHGSHNHPALGSPDVTFYTTLAGIRPTSPGYRTVTIVPPTLEDLTSVTAFHDTPQGRIASSWRHTDNGFELRVTIPPNTDATIQLPSGFQIYHLDGQREPLSITTMTVGSGNYTFICIAR